VSIHDCFDRNWFDRKEANMTREVCFCGWEGETEDREPVYTVDGEWALACPTCGRLDRLEGWPEATRQWTLAEAARRHEGVLKSNAITRSELAA
jgi:hypothetical protein